MSGPTILVADDDASVRLVISQTLAQEGYHVRATNTMSALWRWIQAGEGDLLITDVYMPDESIFDLLPQIRRTRPELPIIVISAQSTVLTAAMASDHGAYDYLPKPFDIDKLAETVRRALQKKPSRGQETTGRRAEKDEALPLIGRSKPMQSVYRVIARVMNNDLTVLIEGESGTGKERVARALHEFSRRSNSPFATISLAGAGGSRLETELFGANGKLAEAQGGTLFLEDVDDLPTEAQTRLVGLLQSVDPSVRPNVRLIAAAQRSLGALVRSGAFRQDLFYRLNVVTIPLPPLRERLDDIGDLARAFLVRARREGLPEKTLDASGIERLKAHDWPGNVRELENLLKRVLALSPVMVISAREIERELGATRATMGVPAEEPDTFEDVVARRLTSIFAAAGPELPPAGLYDRLLAEVERPLIQHALQATKGNQIRAAAVLGINRNTLRKKIQTLGIRAGRSD